MTHFFDSKNRQKSGENPAREPPEPKAVEPAAKESVARAHVAQLQATLGNRATHQLLTGEAEAPEPIQRAVNRTGIPDPVLAKMENHFGQDFSSVKVHPSEPSVKDAGALAYTQSEHIHFAPGQFKPESDAGQTLLGHELTHVVQQREGRAPVTGQLADGTPVNDNPALEREADREGANAVQAKRSPSGPAYQSSPQGDALQFFLKQDQKKLPLKITHGGTVTTNLIDYGGKGKGASVTGPEGTMTAAENLSADNVKDKPGGPTTDGVRTIARAMTQLTDKKYIAGHLLNSHLGGVGDHAKNITAFSAKTNSQHLHFTEKHVKRYVKEGFYVNYKIDATERAKPTNLAKKVKTEWQRLDDQGKPDPSDLHSAEFNCEQHTAQHGQGTLTASILKDDQALATSRKFAQNVLKRAKLEVDEKTRNAILDILTAAEFKDGKLQDMQETKDQLAELELDKQKIQTIMGLITIPA